MRAQKNRIRTIKRLDGTPGNVLQHVGAQGSKGGFGIVWTFDVSLRGPYSALWMASTTWSAL